MNCEEFIVEVVKLDLVGMGSGTDGWSSFRLRNVSGRRRRGSYDFGFFVL